MSLKAKTCRVLNSSAKPLTKHQRYYRRHALKRKENAKEYYHSIKKGVEMAGPSTNSSTEQEHETRDAQEQKECMPHTEDSTVDSLSKAFKSVSVQTPNESPVILKKFTLTPEEVNDDFEYLMSPPLCERFWGFYLYLDSVNDRYDRWASEHGGVSEWHKLCTDEDVATCDLHIQAGKELIDDIRSTLEFGALYIEPRENLTILLHRISFMLVSIGEGLARLTS
ncbi:hypothetical protein FB446DRAFT_792743 [Lentinula raphanica]|nr:hypothetical protein FB446DRAFT_792743 [Lentinula raphanica]